jgi:acetylornithine deacetylase/succinyl-diaminopimelate desuccinylase-like protein
MAINLDGGGGNLKNGTPFYFEVGTSEKTYVTYTLETTSAGGHGSLPGPDNAIYRLSDGLGRLAAFKFPVMLTATTRASFNELASVDPGPLSADMKAVAQPQPDLAAAERLSQNVRLNALLRTTCVATLISGGHAENALPQRARATIQCRMMPGDTEANVRDLLVSTVNDTGIRVTLDAAPIVSPESPPTPQFMAKISVLAHSMWPGVPIIPTMATGFSDDRQTRNAGIPSYDVSGVWEDVDENRAHGRDERVGVQAFDDSVEFTYRLIKAMGKQK